MRTAGAYGVLPSAADPISATSGSGAWANGTYVQVSASAAAGISLAGAQLNAGASSGNELEIGVASGAAGAETERSSIRTGVTGGIRPQPLLLPIPVSGIGGVRVAVRHRNADATPRTCDVKVITVAEAAAPTTTQPFASAPSAANGATIAASGTPWANPAWAELTSGLGVPIALAGLGYKASTTANFTEFEFGTGAAGAEVVLTLLRGYVTGGPRHQWMMLPGVHEVAASTRLAVRMRKSGTSTSGTRLGAALYYSDLVMTIPIQRVTQVVRLIPVDDGAA